MRSLRLFFDQMFDADAAQAVSDQGHDVLRACDVGSSRANDREILQKAMHEGRGERLKAEG